MPPKIAGKYDDTVNQLLFIRSLRLIDDESSEAQGPNS